MGAPERPTRLIPPLAKVEFRTPTLSGSVDSDYDELVRYRPDIGCGNRSTVHGVTASVTTFRQRRRRTCRYRARTGVEALIHRRPTRMIRRRSATDSANVR